MDFEVPLETITELKEMNKLMMTDLGGYGGAVSTLHPSPKRSETERLIRDIVGKFKIVKASIEDCRYLFSNSVSPEEALKTLINWGAEIVIITLGEDGSIISDCKDSFEISAFKTRTVDTTGAGDVYCSAF